MKAFLARRPLQIATFSIVGVSNTAVDAGVFALLVVLFGWHDGPPAILASALGFLAGSANSYFWNSRVTFRTGHRASERSTVLRFLVVQITGVAIAAITSALVLALPLPGSTAQTLIVAKGAAIVFGAVWNFSLQLQWVFAGPRRSH